MAWFGKKQKKEVEKVGMSETEKQLHETFEYLKKLSEGNGKGTLGIVIGASKMQKEDSEEMVKFLEKMIEDEKESIKRYEEELLDESLSKEMRECTQWLLEFCQKSLESNIESLKWHKERIKKCEEEIEKYSKLIK
jgi:radical SAM superfamily enzyme YgiQ (UPF0313 family)